MRDGKRKPHSNMSTTQLVSIHQVSRCIREELQIIYYKLERHIREVSAKYPSTQGVYMNLCPIHFETASIEVPVLHNCP